MRQVREADTPAKVAQAKRRRDRWLRRQCWSLSQRSFVHAAFYAAWAVSTSEPVGDSDSEDEEAEAAEAAEAAEEAEAA